MISPRRITIGIVFLLIVLVFLHVRRQVNPDYDARLLATRPEAENVPSKGFLDPVSKPPPPPGTAPPLDLTDQTDDQKGGVVEDPRKHDPKEILKDHAKEEVKDGLKKGSQIVTSKVVVMAAQKKDDMSWLRKEMPDIETLVYVVDDPEAKYKVPMDKGHEGMVYLTYLIDNYDNLPDVMAFMHAHQQAWHNNDWLSSDAAQMLRALSVPHVQRVGYFNMRCHWDPGCPSWMHPFDPSNRTDISKPEERILADAFREIFPGREVPQTIATPCCAQFALSKETVLKVPRETLKGYRQWLIDTPLDSVISGRVWEYLWHYIFTEFTPEVCAPVDVCYCDGYGVCFGGSDDFDKFKKDWNEMRMMQIVMANWEEEYKKEGRILTDNAAKIKGYVGQSISTLVAPLMMRIEQAKTRGQDPELRAKDSGRSWKAGDGF